MINSIGYNEHYLAEEGYTEENKKLNKEITINMNNKGWIGVDLDGTLATHMEMEVWDGSIGEPIKSMIDRIKQWRESGIRVKIVTARVFATFNDVEDNRNIEYQKQLIEDWLYKHLGFTLEITCSKDFYMIELWDDRAVRVKYNKGERCCNG